MLRSLVGSEMCIRDSDNDGVCNDDDCAPDNPNLPTTPGTACNDGNPSTTNDEIQANGCDCVGVLPPCTIPTANTPTVSAGTCYNTNPNNDVSITIDNVSDANIAGIVAGNNYDVSGGVLYNADPNTNINLYAICLLYTSPSPRDS